MLKVVEEKEDEKWQAHCILVKGGEKREERGKSNSVASSARLGVCVGRLVPRRHASG